MGLSSVCGDGTELSVRFGRLLHGFNLDVVSHCEKAIELEPTLLEGYGCLSTLLMVQEPAPSHSADCVLFRSGESTWLQPKSWRVSQLMVVARRMT